MVKAAVLVRTSEAAVFLWAAGFAADFLDFGFENDCHIGFGRFAQKHSDDLFPEPSQNSWPRVFSWYAMR